MINLLPNELNQYKNLSVDDWVITEVDDTPIKYVFILKKDDKTVVFFLNKANIPSKKLSTESDMYELWYLDFEDAKLLTYEQAMDNNIVLSNIGSLINKYSK
jgi:regulatory protein YycI of two-component signal transduction system YycFG